MAVTVAIDASVLVAALPSNSKYHWLIEMLLDAQIDLYVTEEMLKEYREALKTKYSEAVANSFLTALQHLPNVYPTRSLGSIDFPKVSVGNMEEFKDSIGWE